MPATTFVDDLAVLTELIATGNDLDGVKVHLSTTAPPLVGGMVLTSFVEAAFPGYAALTITWGTPYFTLSGDPEVDSQVLAFHATSAPPGAVTVLAYFVTDTAGAVLKFADVLATPVTIGAAGQGLGFVIAMLRYAFQTIQLP